MTQLVATSSVQTSVAEETRTHLQLALRHMEQGANELLAAVQAQRASSLGELLTDVWTEHGALMRIVARCMDTLED